MNMQSNVLVRRIYAYFRGVFMRNTLPTSGAHRNESGIMNDARLGTHWVAYAKRNNRVMYFEFDNL